MVRAGRRSYSAVGGVIAVDESAARDDLHRARTRRLTRSGVIWLTIIVLIGTVQVWRRQWGDAAIFAAAAMLLIADALGWLSRLDHLPRPSRRVLLWGFLFLGVPLALARRHDLMAMILVIVVGIGAVLAVWSQRGPENGERGRSSPTLRLLGFSWAAIWAVGCLWELLQAVLGALDASGRKVHPALSDLLDPLVGTPFGQAAFVACWIAGGVYLMRRGVRR